MSWWMFDENFWGFVDRCWILGWENLFDVNVIIEENLRTTCKETQSSEAVSKDQSAQSNIDINA